MAILKILLSDSNDKNAHIFHLNTQKEETKDTQQYTQHMN